MSDIRIAATNSIGAVDNWLKALAGNLTGSTVTGFRQTKVQFADVLTETLSAGTEATTTPDYGSTDPIQFSVGGTQIKATRTDFSQGALNATQRPTDLAISGNGFFVLSKVPNPTKMSDLVFSRDGSFTFDLQPKPDLISSADRAKLGGNSQVGVLRLVNSSGFFVMGVTGNYTPSGTDGIPGTAIPPIDGRANDGEALSPTTLEPKRNEDVLPAPNPTKDPSQQLQGMGLKPIEFPFIKDSFGTYSLNDDLLGHVSFNKSGMLLDTLTQDVPISTESFELNGTVALSQAPQTGRVNVQDQRHYNKYVGVMAFGAPDGLARDAGTGFTWTPSAGPAFIGAAATEQGPVGSNNEISAGSLETSNSSVNTALPELTIAQKSFTANVKIVSVGNALVDDVNQLIR